MDFVKISEGLTLAQTVAEAGKRKLRLPSNLELDERLVKSDAWKSEKSMYPCRTGTLVVYEAWGKPFKSKLQWEGFTVLIPKKFQGKKNLALVCNHPDFQPKGTTFSSNKFTAMALPGEDGWYDPEPRFGLPMGERKDYADSRRYLWRYQDDAFIGLVVRGYLVFLGDYRRDVVALRGPSRLYGVFGVAGKNKAVKHIHEWKCECGATKSVR